MRIQSFRKKRPQNYTITFDNGSTAHCVFQPDPGIDRLAPLLGLDVDPELSTWQIIRMDGHEVYYKVPGGKYYFFDTWHLAFGYTFLTDIPQVAHENNQDQTQRTIEVSSYPF